MCEHPYPWDFDQRSAQLGNLFSEIRSELRLGLSRPLRLTLGRTPLQPLRPELGPQSLVWTPQTQI